MGRMRFDLDLGGVALDVLHACLHLRYSMYSTRKEEGLRDKRQKGPSCVCVCMLNEKKKEPSSLIFTITKSM